MIHPNVSQPLRRWSQILLSLIVIASLLAGCRLPWQTQSDDPRTKTNGSDEITSVIPTSEPRQDLPPAIVEVTPLPDTYIGLEESISLYFNQGMDRESVEAAIHFEPNTSGLFTWEDDSIVTFTPDQPLSAGSNLRLVLSTSAQALNRESLQSPVEVNFMTAEYLEVLQTVPAHNTQDVNPESVIFVAFNQPVVPLGGEADALPGFNLTPEVEGTGEWLNTSTYAFTPEPTMNGGTQYTLTLNPALTAASGASLKPDEKSSFQFTTTHPQVLTIQPFEGHSLSLDGPIEIQFNIRMNPSSVEENFNLISPSGINVNGAFEWEEDFTKLTFRPTTNLTRNSRYTLQLNADAQSYGGLPLQTPLETQRTTYSAFSISPTPQTGFESYYAQYGRYEIKFTTPVDKDTYKDRVNINPGVNAQGLYLTDSGRTLNITGYFDPETEYTITLDQDLQDIWGGQLGTQTTFTFFTPSLTPSISIVLGMTTHNLVFVPAAASEVVLQATNINTVTLEISPISVNGLITLLHPDNYDYRQVFLPEVLETSTQNFNLDRNKSQAVTIPLSYQGAPLSPGIYFLQVSSNDIPGDPTERYQKLYLIVCENNLVMKIAPEQAVIWGTRLADYSPLSQTPIEVYNTEGEIVASGQTDSNGTFEQTFERFDEPYSSFFTLAGEPGQSDFAFSISSWGHDYALYEMGIRSNPLPTMTEAYIYTDRPLYRPGDTIQFKAIIFNRENGLPAHPSLETVSVAVYSDPGMTGRSDALFSQDLALSRFGTLAGSVDLPEDAPTGLYYIEIKDGEDYIETLYFDVAAYRKPTIDLSVEISETDIKVGDDLSVEIQGDTYFGLPVAGQPFTWSLTRDDAFFDLRGYRTGPLSTDWLMPRFSYDFPFGTLIQSGEGQTDENGHASLSLTGDDFVMDETIPGNPQNFKLEVSLVDQTGLSVSQTQTITVHPESFYIGAQSDAYFGRANTPFEFSILTVGWDQESVGNIPLEAVFETIEWRVEQTNNPEMPYEYIPQTTFVASASPITDNDGKARLSFTPPKPGTYQLSLFSGDAVTQMIVWVSGEGQALWPQQTQNQITLTADADEYQPGQTAEIFFPNPFPQGVQALISIERGEVMESQIVTIEGSGYAFEIPITENSVPNLYVSVILLGKEQAGQPNFRHGTLNLRVSPQIKTLNVDLVVNPSLAEPGDSVSATLKITDQQGNPVQGEFSMAVVDKALLAMIAPNRNSILDVFYRNQPLSVQTSISLKTYASQLSLTSMELGGMGGGGDASQQPTLREEFPDTAFWQANILTGADGTAQLAIPMPDSLTTWVVNVRGLTEDYLVGEGEAEILTQKELMIQPVTPRFLVDGDRVEMAAVVYNNASETLDIDVSLQAVGFSLESSPAQNQKITLNPGENRRVTWWGGVESVPTASLVFQALAGSLSDASTPVWGDLEIKRYNMPQTFSTTGQLQQAGQRLELVNLPPSKDPNSGELSLKLTPTLTATLIEGLEALEAAPYDDTVSTLSRLLANLHIYNALNSLGIESPQLQADLPELIEAGINTLLDAQNFDGGWSWWSNDGTSTSDPFITSYVLLGLLQASDAGIEVAETFTSRAVDYLNTQLRWPGEIESSAGLDRLVFQLYALRTTNLYLSEYLDGLFTRRSELSPWAIGLLALTYNDIGSSSQRTTTLLADLEAQAVRSATGVHWESESNSWLMPGSPTFNTAVGLFAIAQLDPASTSLPLAVQYLLIHRKADGLWQSNFTSAWALMAVTEALQGTGDYQADFTYQASLNDIQIASGTATGADSSSPVSAVVPISDIFPDDPNALLIERGEGSGTLYYRADLQTYQPAATADPINRGVVINRTYYPTGEGCPAAEGCVPIEGINWDQTDPSQMVTVALTVVISHDMYQFMLEDFIPAGTEILNQSFLTTQNLPQEPAPLFDPRDPFGEGWGWWYFNGPQIYDDHILWTADYVPAGTYTLTYQLLPTQRGTYQVLPAHGWQYFYPEVEGSSAGNLFTID